MDHIPLCSDNWAHAPIEIPYVCNERFHYDDLGFLTYPDRVKIDINSLGYDGLVALKLKDAAPFLQSWLWFGLLGEALQVGSRHTTAPQGLSSKLFLKAIGNEEFLCTSHLMDAISSHKRKSRASIYGDWHLSRVSSCIEIASAFIQKATATLLFERSISSNMKMEDLPIVFHILLACQMLNQTLLDGFHIPRYPRLGSLVGAQPSDPESLKLVDYLLRRSGWCPKNIERLPKNIVFRYHLSFYRQSVACEGSDLIRENGCECQLAGHKAFLPRHTHPHCCCMLVAASGSDIDAAAKDGKIVLFRFQNEEGRPRMLTLRAIDLGQEPSIPYVAISHVRSAGLMNGLAYSLPFCQLSLIQSLVDQLGRTDPAGTLFWLDSLSLPKDRQLRKTSLLSTWDIYGRASHVLVLDPPLYQHTFCSPQEALIRIRYSSWKRRLWTLEEGISAKVLVFRFANCMASLGDLLDQFEDESKCNTSKLQLLKKQEFPSTEISCYAFTNNRLRTVLKRFADDILSWSRSSEDPAARTPPIDCQGIYKLHVSKILRFGFLAASRFRYFVEDDEYQAIPAVCMSLVKVYGGAADQSGKEALDTKLDSVYRRLGKMISVNLAVVNPDSAVVAERLETTQN